MFHVSSHDLGPRVVLVPQHPKTATWREDGLPPRVCFAPTVEKCLASLSGAEMACLVIGETLPRRKRVEGIWCHANPVVYQTNKRLRRPPQDRSDFALTGERWSLGPIEVERVGFVCLEHLTHHGRTVVVDRRWTLAERLGQDYRNWDNDFLTKE